MLLQFEDCPEPPPPLPCPGAELPPAPLPVVRVQVEEEESQLCTQGFVIVTFDIQTGDWEEGDALHLTAIAVAHPVTASDKDDASGADSGDCIEQPSQHPIELYSNSCKEPEYDVLEFIDGPQPSRSVGRMQLALPAYGGRFRVKYVRSCLTASYQRETVAVASSRVFSVPFSVQWSHPDKLLPSSASVRRRGTGDILDKSRQQEMQGRVVAYVEDFCNISTLAVVISAQNQNGDLNIEGQKLNTDFSRSTDLVMGRIMAWAYECEDSAGGGDGGGIQEDVKDTYVTVVFEYDIAEVDSASHSVHGIRIAYSVVKLPPASISMVYLRSIGWVYGTLDGAVDDRITCRLPYSPTDALLAPAAPQCLLPLTPAHLAHPGGGSHATVGFDCAFCGAAIVHPTSVRQISELPSGLFDNVSPPVICHIF